MNKLYETIQYGLINALQIDDNDSSINYRKSDINSEISKMPSLSELYKIFKNDSESIFEYNTKNCITLITDADRRLSLHEYKPGQNLKFLKISDEKLKQSDNEIYILIPDLHGISQYIHLWQLPSYTNKLQAYTRTKTNNEDIAVEDLSGYQNCQDILNLVGNNIDKFPAIDYCMKQRVSIYDNKFVGYLPSIGQLNYLQHYSDLINHILQYIGSKPIIFDNTGYWSSSKIYLTNRAYAWIMLDKAPDRHDAGSSDAFTAYGAYVNLYTLPLYKKKLIFNNERTTTCISYR